MVCWATVLLLLSRVVSTGCSTVAGLRSVAPAQSPYDQPEILWVSSKFGNDDWEFCGYNSSTPCKTISRALKEWPSEIWLLDGNYNASEVHVTAPETTNGGTQVQRYNFGQSAGYKSTATYFVSVTGAAAKATEKVVIDYDEQ